jgi:phosphoserine phosphatase
MKIGLFLNVDGVLTEESINVQIARLLGIEKEHSEIENKFLEGRIAPEEYNKRFIPLLQRAGFSESFMAKNFSRIKMRYNYEKLLKQIDNTFLVSSGPSYFIDILSKKYNIPAGRVLCSRYQFDNKGLISKCVAPVSSHMKVKFVKSHFRKFDIVIGVAYSPEFDAIFLTPCHVRVLVDDFRLGYVCVKEIDTLMELIESINNLGHKYSLKTYNKFKEFDTGIDRLLQTSPYEKNVFIMTPFRENIRYRSTINSIGNVQKCLHDGKLTDIISMSK